ncbi:MAG: TrkA C-terminal domain-containing protein, partial [Xanthomonadales bacterium]|nr:TrkA C-terminal domain-containing protein [Xanthomonadales bacterium]
DASLRRYVTEVSVPKGSSLIGKTATQAKLREVLGLSLLRVHRQYDKDKNQSPISKPWQSHGRYGRDEGNGWYSYVPWPEATFAANDHLQLEGDPSALLKRQGDGFLEILDSEKGGEIDVTGMQTGEVALAPGSRSIGATLEDAAFSQRYG